MTDNSNQRRANTIALTLLVHHVQCYRMAWLQFQTCTCGDWPQNKCAPGTADLVCCTFQWCSTAWSDKRTQCMRHVGDQRRRPILRAIAKFASPENTHEHRRLLWWYNALFSYTCNYITANLYISYIHMLCNSYDTHKLNNTLLAMVGRVCKWRSCCVGSRWVRKRSGHWQVWRAGCSWGSRTDTHLLWIVTYSIVELV